MSVSFGADDTNDVTDAIIAELRRRGFDVIVHGRPAGDRSPWAWVAEAVARDVSEGRADTGIVCCYTGTGVSIAANKVPGIRAALCADAEVVRGARAWNNANVLCLSLARTQPEEVPALIQAWFAPIEVDPEERPSIEHIATLERSHTTAPDP